MNKIVSYIIIFIALGLAAFNVYHIDFNSMWADDSRTAIYGVLVSLIVILIVLINIQSLKVKEKLK
ncbi:MAG: hypothetical protein VW010_06045 [Flavobacteriaceae bacterium]|jgi:hypothetical protein|nr:hypothetical protein [Flavobacteriaceae bacterium]